MSTADEATTLLGVYPDESTAASAARALRKSGFGPSRLSLISEYPFPEGAVDIEEPRVTLQWIALAAGAVGIAAGIGLTVGTSLLYPLLTGHMSVLPAPPYALISYELMMLFTIVSTVVGFSVVTVRNRLRGGMPDEPLLHEEHLGLLVVCETDDERTRARDILNGAQPARLHEVAGRHL